MDAATLQARIYAGYAKAALRLGYSYDVYRPTDANNPTTAPATKVVTLPASFAPAGNNFKFTKAGDFNGVLWSALADGAQLQVGDYLVCAGHPTFYVAAKQDLLPILCVKCENQITVTRPQGAQAPGLNAYGGSTVATEQSVMQNWPCALVLDARGRVQEVGLPMDLPSPFFDIYLPALSSIDVRTGDIITDERNRRYIVAASEGSSLGWRLMAQQAVT